MVDWALKTEQLSIYFDLSHPELEIQESVNNLRTFNALMQFRHTCSFVPNDVSTVKLKNV